MAKAEPTVPVGDWLGYTLAEIYPTVIPQLDWDALPEVTAVLSEHPRKTM